MGNVKYLLMAMSICFVVASNCLLRVFSNRKCAKNQGDIFMFNSALSVVWFVILGIWYLASGAPKVSPAAYVFGVVYGVVMCAFLLTKTCSLGAGPVSITILIGNCAFIVPTWFGVLYAGEPAINLIQYLGMALLVVALVFCVNPKKSGEKLTKRWFIYVFCFFIAGCCLGVVNKVFGMSDVSGEVNAMMLTASLVTAVVFAVTGIVINKVSGKEMPKVRGEGWIFVLLCGVLSCLYQRINVMLPKEIISVIFFPINNGAGVILTTVMAKILFKEKLLKMQVVGILLGLLGIIMIGCSSLFYMLLGL